MVVIGRGEVFAGVGVDAHIGGYGSDGENDVQGRGEGARREAPTARDAAGAAMTTGLCTV